MPLRFLRHGVIHSIAVVFCRAAEDRTRAACPPAMRTTTIRQPALLKSSFGPPGIEPGLHAPEACVLPVYYGPKEDSIRDMYNTYRCGREYFLAVARKFRDPGSRSRKLARHRCALHRATKYAAGHIYSSLCTQPIKH